MSTRRPELGKSKVVEEIPRACCDEAAAVDFLERKRWPETPCCVHCGSVEVYQMTDRNTGERNKRFLWRCRDCKKQYTVRVNSIFEDSHISLRHWCYALWASVAGKNGVSALEISRKLQITHKSALFMLHRIRHAMSPNPPEPQEQMTGIVEADEGYVGGRPRGKPWKHGAEKQGRANWSDKTPVLAAIQRGGELRTRVVADVTPETLRDFIRANVSPKAMLVTDDRRAYRSIAKSESMKHGIVRHIQGEHVRRGAPEVHTQCCDGFYSLLKRGLNGTFHAVSEKHLHRYVDEFAWRYNTRTMNDGQRIEAAILATNNRRLTYRQQTA